ncbi:MAG: hypothetical protein ACLTIG_01765 [Roseburia hominis]
MDTWYWALEYVRVFFAYVMILFVWPSVVFRDYLRGRSRTVRFAFCVTVPVVLLNTVVLSLGVFHILYGWLIAVLFYGTLLLGLLRWHPVRREQIKKDLPPVSGNLRHPAFAASPAQQSKRRDRACTCTIQAEHTGTALRLSDAGGGCVLWHGVFFLRGIP